MEKPSGRYGDIVAPHELQAEDVPLMPSAAAARPRALPSPSEPSEQERELHNLTHLPYRSWCPVCVQSKGRHSPHKAIKDRKAVLHIDFGFLSSKEAPGDYITVFTAIDTRTQMAMAVNLSLIHI